ncbi:MAG: hypothetical protein U0802_11700 [Candidatus Binatia bacterium]
MAMGNRAAAGAALLVSLLAGADVHAADGPVLVVDGGSGRRGETVAVAIRLADDPQDTAYTADLDIDFPPDLVAFTPPVASACSLAPRLAATHLIGGQLRAPGQLTLAIFARGLQNHPLGDGDLATCAFRILPDANRSPATLALPFASLNDADGRSLSTDAPDGAIVISDAPGQPTPTPLPVPDCVADCDGDGVVAVNEVIRGVNIALGNQPLSECPEADADGDGQVTISELIAAVNDVIGGC